MGKVHKTCGSDRCGNWAACERRNPGKVQASKKREHDESLNDAVVDLIRANLKRGAAK